MFSASITLLNGSPFHSPVTRKCIYHLHKTKPAVASSDKRNPRECEDYHSLSIFTFIANTFTGLSPKCGCVIVLISYPSYGTSILRLESSRFGYPFVIIRRSYSRNIIRLFQ
ncbi:hypothetical protein APECO1_4173 [Escherichia coli APEC O1]|uniref:Uncharacterized protein n=1 Tax=Escherichia coli O1:K1 / APEC TaxID=405955 RepID=A0A0H2Z163_ECOK1|nr:hypothetical protein APECO1_4173 [Escherichia coli APEC O1]